MRRVGFDPGLTERFTGQLRRVINKDGSFNVRRRGTTWRDFHPYLYLINMRWGPFFGTLFLGYVVANTAFALLYYAIGTNQLQGAEAFTAWRRFLNAFFFSAHTLTTVGYGNIYPKGLDAEILSSFEALVGVLAFAVATGLLFGRVSRPSARLGFSRNILVSPYQDGTSLQFRVVNLRSNSLMELEVRTLLMIVEMSEGELKRTYKQLRMEREQVLFLPLTWTVVHPIDAESPLRGMTQEELADLQAEFLILIKAYDDTFSQTVLVRHSYRHDEMVWGKQFAPAFSVDDDGDLVLQVSKVGEIA
jgi:inward rectifier potassium channel